MLYSIGDELFFAAVYYALNADDYNNYPSEYIYTCSFHNAFIINSLHACSTSTILSVCCKVQVLNGIIAINKYIHHQNTYT